MKAQLEKLVQSLSEENFNILVKEYAKQYYNTSEVNIINGPYDGGNDLVYYKKSEPVKRNIQITIQQTQLERKIIKDVIKAAENVSNYSYLNTLDFYISRKLTEQFKKKLIREAEINHGINLKFIDAGKLVDDTDAYPEIIDLIYQLHGIYHISNETKLDKQSRVLLNMLTDSSNTGDLKKQFIHSIILMEIFSYPKPTLDELYLKISDKLPGDYNKSKVKN